MNIVCDINHPAHVNFLKPAMRRLFESGHEITITCLIRGKLPSIVEKELSDYRISYIGKHRNNKLSIILDANIKRFFALLFFLLNKRIDIGISVGSHTFGLALKILGKPNIQFDDDPERKLNVFLEILTSTELIFPPIVNSKCNIRKMNALKEWAYLSPRYFFPNTDELERYDVRPHQYIFIREISTKSLNYSAQFPNLISTFANRLPRKFKVLLSLEDKSTIDKYPCEWTLLKEPLDDIHSLMYHSRVIISSGDSVAREGSLLGVPSIYCGLRKMKANQMLCKKGMLFVKEPKHVSECVNGIISGELQVDDRDEFRRKLMEDWEDVTDFIVRKVEFYAKQP